MDLLPRCHDVSGGRINRIVVVPGGRLAEVGRHEEPFARDGIHRRLHAFPMAPVSDEATVRSWSH